MRHDLRSGWELQSSCKVKASGAEISTTAFRPAGWIKTAVPSTVLAAQLANKLVPDPFYGMNLRQIAGADYPVGKNFANLPMPENSPYRCSWWYRTEFTLPAAFHGKHVGLHFDGINYRANVWLNGKQIANSNDVAGTWRLFELDVTGALKPAINVLAVEVIAPTETDLGLTWVDWAPAPPDKDMGLWRPVYLTASDDVSIAHPYVKTQLDPDLATAHITLEAEITNHSDRSIAGEIMAGFARLAEKAAPLLSQPISLAAHETRAITFEPSRYPELNVKNPRIWWPAEMGDSPLYEAVLAFRPASAARGLKATSRETSGPALTARLQAVPLPNADMSGSAVQLRAVRLPNDAAARAEGAVPAILAHSTFGIRHVTSELINGQRLFRINGKPLLIRGGGWTPDLLLREDHKRMEDEFRMTRDMGLNTIRLEGKLETDDFFDLADRYGILVMPGWCCCDFWEKWDKWTDETKTIAAASLADQIRRLRSHPSVFVWLNGSDNPPPPEIEQMYLDIEKEYDWQLPVISSATKRPTTVTGQSGVKMEGPYDYVPPSYWLDDTQRGGAFGFATEISPGPAIPTLQSIERFIPREHLWPAKDDQFWKYHSGGGQFASLNIYTAALDQRYGPSTSLADFVRKSQAAAYEGERAMFEGYARNKYSFEGERQRATAATIQREESPAPQKSWPATGVIQWMLNNAWPSMIWHLYDVYLVPGGGYYGTKKATEPLHVQYSYDDGSVVVISGPKTPAQHVRVSAELYGLDMTRHQAGEDESDVQPDSVWQTKIMLPESAPDSQKTFFLRLQLKDAAGKVLDENLYWLSTQADTLDQQHGTWYYTPEAQVADLTGLQTLPTTKLAASYTTQQHGGETTVQVRLHNPSKTLAFMVHLRVAHGPHGQDIAPVFWSDNYVSIFPGEERSVIGTFEHSGAEPVIEMDGWNVAAETIRHASSTH